MAAPVVLKKKSMAKSVWLRFCKNRLAVLGLIVFSCIVLSMIFAELIVPYQTALATDYTIRSQPPGNGHLFGTDNYGRDIFARIIHATKYSLLMGIGAVAVGITIGGLLGALAGFYGGWVDSVIVRIMDTIICIPFLLLVLAIVAALGTGLKNVLIALMIAMVPTYTRVIRSSVMTVVDMDYIEAARSCGTPNYFIVLKHVLPNAIGPIIVQATMTVGTMIIQAASISFLGMGIQPPTPEWGAMLSEGKNFMTSAPHLAIFPGLAIAVTVLSINLMGDGLRDALDPRLKD